MTWLALREEIVREFSELVVFVPDFEGTRFFSLEDPKEAVERVSRWRLFNRPKRNAAARRRYSENEEVRTYHREYLAAWRERNREKMREYGRAYRARKKAVGR